MTEPAAAHSVHDAATDRELIVASYNIHRCVGSDGRRDAGRVAEVLRGIDADVIGLQEVDSRPGAGHESLQLDYLAAETRLTPVAGPTIRHHSGTYGNALLTRLPVQAIRREDIGLPGREPRGVLDVDLRWGTETLRVLVTHFGLQASERRRQVGRLLTLLAGAQPSLTFVLADANEWLPLRRTLRPLDHLLGHSVAVHSFPARWPLLALDRIWAHPGHRLGRARAYGDPPARIASDHLPVVVPVYGG